MNVPIGSQWHIIIHVVPITVQAIKFNEEHSHGSLVALAIAIIAIFAAVNFSKVHSTFYIVHVHESKFNVPHMQY